MGIRGDKQEIEADTSCVSRNLSRQTEAARPHSHFSSTWLGAPEGCMADAGRVPLQRETGEMLDSVTMAPRGNKALWLTGITSPWLLREMLSTSWRHPDMDALYSRCHSTTEKVMRCGRLLSQLPAEILQRSCRFKPCPGLELALRGLGGRDLMCHLSASSTLSMA